MSKSHIYRIQIHCNKQMHRDIKAFAERRGLSQSAASRFLIERALIQRNDEIVGRLDRVDSYLESILHAASASRVLAAELASSSGSHLSSEDLRERISKLMKRYKQSAN